jgi:hypothetical protein
VVLEGVKENKVEEEETSPHEKRSKSEKKLHEALAYPHVGSFNFAERKCPKI